MALPDWMKECSGSWTGRSCLYMPWEEDESKRQDEGASTMEVVLGEGGEYAVIRNGWHYANTPQSGHMIVCVSKEGAATVGWSDSWHQNGSVMLLSGGIEDGKVVVKGTYQYPGYPEWGWWISLWREGDELVFQMDNVNPEVGPEVAVLGRYTR